MCLTGDVRLEFLRNSARRLTMRERIKKRGGEPSLSTTGIRKVPVKTKVSMELSEGSP